MKKDTYMENGNKKIIKITALNSSFDIFINIMCSFEIVYKHFNAPFQIQFLDIIAKIIIASI